jgi:NitT/TauT family transport system substrate-binding protein
MENEVPVIATLRHQQRSETDIHMFSGDNPMRRNVLLFLLVLTLLLSACARSALAPGPDEAATRSGETSLTQIRLPMGYVADPQFAPFYVAKDRGYFAAEGLDVTFDYSFETDGITLVGANELPFAVVSGEQVILARAQELPIVYVAEWYQRFPIAVVSKEESGIREPSDLPGHIVGLPAYFGASYVGYTGLLSATGIDEAAVSTEEIGYTQVEALLTDRVDAVVGYANNEPVQLRQQGEAVNVIYVADYVDMVGNGIVTNETVIAENPELVQGLVRAFLHGLADTLADPEAAYTISKKYVEGLDDSRMPVLEASLPMWQAPQLGVSDVASWEQTENALLEAGLLDGLLPNLDVLSTNQFVNAAQQ